jgi:dihydroorotate dehydrogenase subfamily 1
MVNLSAHFRDLSFPNPVLTAAGPTSRDGNTLVSAVEGGVGGLVTKTVSVKPAEIPYPNMAALHHGRVGSRRGMLNAELWSELPIELWLKKEYPKALRTGLPVIASLGYTPDDVTELGPKLEKVGIHALEFSTHYVGGHVDIAKALRDCVNIPIIAKLSPKVDVAKVAKQLEPHVDGFAAINTLGPCLHIDIETGKPVLGSENGYGWMSGTSLKPVALRCVADIAQTVDKPIFGVGGVMNGEDAIEFIMVGALAVQVCTVAILEGPTAYGRIASEIYKWLDSHDFESLDDIRGMALKHLAKGVSLEPPPKLDLEKCTLCGLCAKSCVYNAVTVDKGKGTINIDPDACQACGMCISICPHHALSLN